MTVARHLACVLILVSPTVGSAQSAESFPQVPQIIMRRHCGPSRYSLMVRLQAPRPAWQPYAASADATPPSPTDFRLQLNPGLAPEQVAEQRRQLEAALSTTAANHSPRSVPLTLLLPPAEGPQVIQGYPGRFAPVVAADDDRHAGHGPRPALPRP